jgi:hypothetical protein
MNFKQFVPLKFFKLYADFKNRNQSPEEIFTRIYQKKYWGVASNGEQFFSGDGTVDLAAEQYKEMLINFIKENAIKSIFEIGCGDFTIMKSVLESTPQTQYHGVDIVKDLINHLNQNYQSQSIKFSQVDAITATAFPPADLCIIRQVLQHLSNQQIEDILEKTKTFKYVIVTEHLPLNPKIINADKATGGYIRLQNKEISGVYINQAPFNQSIKELLSYSQNDKDYDGKIVPAIMQTVLIENDTKA